MHLCGGAAGCAVVRGRECSGRAVFAMLFPCVVGRVELASTNQSIAALEAASNPSDVEGLASTHGGPLHGTASSRRLMLLVACSTSMVSQRPSRQCGQHETSMPATRLMKAAASSRA